MLFTLEILEIKINFCSYPLKDFNNGLNRKAKPK